MNHKIKNPVIPGFYPDPSICRAGDDFYLACSSFELFPGIPVFHSRDLAHWELSGYALTEENGFHVEKNSMTGGLMAPTLRYHDGTFYMINANFCDRGNYIVTARNPAGPWSQPHWLDDVPGIDASIFFDDDGKCYILGTGNVWDNGTGVKERGIWLAEYDIENFKMAGEPVTIFNSALRVGTSPESPHLYHVGDYYHLVIAEGGTEHYHAVMTARSRDIFGFYEGNPANPVMTHRHMGFSCPVTNVGHADFIELADGSWYAVMLASRLIEGKYKNLGRETFLCPAVWERDWPLLSPETGKLEMEYDMPASLPYTEYPPEPEFDDFTAVSKNSEINKLQLCWNFWGTPYEPFYKVQNSRLILKCISQRLAQEIEPVSFVPRYRKDRFAAFVARRQRDKNTVITCQMTFMPDGTQSAGMAAVGAMNHQYHLERACENGKQIVRFVKYTSEYDVPPHMPGFQSITIRTVVAQAEWEEADIILQIQIEGEQFSVRYGAHKSCLRELCTADGAEMNPEKVGCMAGTMLGMFASGNGTDSDNEAQFDWFEIKTGIGTVKEQGAAEA